MEADRHAEADEHVGDGQDQKVAGGDGATPKQPQRGQKAGKRQDDGNDGDAALEGRGAGMQIRFRVHTYKPARKGAS